MSGTRFEPLLRVRHAHKLHQARKSVTRKLRGTAGACTLVIGVVVIAIFGSGCNTESPPPPRAHADSPTVVFISLDTTRPDFLSAYGHPWSKTPVMDALAAQGILFEDALSPATTTLAAHSSMMTGTYPHRHGVPRNGFRLADANETLAELLKASGYYCAGFVGGFPLDARFNINQGFDTYDYSMVDAVRPQGANVEGHERSAGAVNEAVTEFLQAYDKDQPLFLFVHYFDAHYPYWPPADVLARYDDVPPEMPLTDSVLRKTWNRLVSASEFSILPRIVNRYSPEIGDTGDPVELLFEVLRILARLEHRYAAEIAYVDAQLGNLFKTFKAHGRFDNALIVLTSDHGEELWDHPLFFDHGHNVYHSVAQAVAIVKLPAAAHAGLRVSTPVSTLDWMPSILGYLELAVPQGLDGLDLRFVEGVNTPSERVLFTEATKPHHVERAADVWPNARKAQAAYRQGYKFVDVPYRGEAGLYHLSDDSRESKNILAGGHSHKVAAGLRRELDDWRDDADPYTIAQPTVFQDETREALEALGYVE